MNACPSCRTRSRERLAVVVIEPFQNPTCDLVRCDAILLQRVSVANGDSRILRGLAVNGYAKGRPHFVLPAIAPSDGPRLVVKDGKLFPQLSGELRRELRHAVLLDQREDARLDGRQRGVQPKDRAP